MKMSSTINTPFLHIPIPLPPLIWCPNVYQPVSNSNNTNNRYIALFISVVNWSASFNSRFTPHSIDDILRPDPRSLESRELKATESPLNLSLSKGKKDTFHGSGQLFPNAVLLKDPTNLMERETKDAKILTMKARIVGVGRTPMGGKRCEQLLQGSKYLSWKKVSKARSTCHRRRERRWLRVFRSLSSRQVTIQKFGVM